MFAARTDWETTLNPLTQACDTLKSQNQSFLDLTISNPTQCGFDYPEQWFDGLTSAEAKRYSPTSRGLLSAREAIARYYASRNKSISPDNLILTSSSSEAYVHLFRLLCDSGDAVLIPSPSYPLFYYLTQLNDLDAISYSLCQEGDEWCLDFDMLQSVVTPKTKALLLVNPNNPTGSVISQQQYEQLIDFCAQHDLALICDEVFIDYPLVDEDIDCVVMVEQEKVLTFVINGLSKTLALPQMKLSWIHVSGSEDLVQQALLKLEIIADTFLSVNTPVQLAMPLWLEQRHLIQDQVRARCRYNYDVLKANHAECALDMQAGWCAVLSIDADDEESWCVDLLQQNHVLLHPGYLFDFDTSSSYCVVSLLLPTESFSRGILCLSSC